MALSPAGPAPIAIRSYVCVTALRSMPYCIWSSISPRLFLIRSAFFISSALTYGYSPYSMKLGRW